MEAKRILFDSAHGKHRWGQITNLTKYFFGKKNSVVNWDPIYISIFPTFRCTLSCDMCLTHSKKKENPFGQKPGKDMDFESFKEVLNKFKNALGVNLIGNGEPLLNKDLFRMIDYASNSMKMYTFSGSNGSILGEYIEQVASSPLTQFNVSLNGHNPREFNRMTGMPPQVFEKITTNIRALIAKRNQLKSDVKITVSIILDKINYGHLEDIITFVEGLGVDGVYFFQFLPSQEKGFIAEERCLFKDDLRVQRMFDLINSNRSKRQVQTSLPPLLERSNNCKFCTVPFYNLSVDGERNVGGCSCQLLDLSGNGKFYEDDAWNNHYFKETRNRFLNPEIPLLEPCKRCYNNTPSTRLLSNPNPVLFLFRKIFP